MGVVSGGAESMDPETEVCVAVVPARDSVPKRQYQALEVARLTFDVPEMETSLTFEQYKL